MVAPCGKYQLLHQQGAFLQACGGWRGSRRLWDGQQVCKQARQGPGVWWKSYQSYGVMS